MKRGRKGFAALKGSMGCRDAGDSNNLPTFGAYQLYRGRFVKRGRKGSAALKQYRGTGVGAPAGGHRWAGPRGDLGILLGVRSNTAC